MPRLLAMLCVLAVFVPSFFMTGVSRSLFVPLSLAVGFSMIASFLLSSTLVPVLSVWLLRDAPAVRRGRAADWVDARCASGWRARCGGSRRRAALLVAATCSRPSAIVALVGPRLGREIFPASAPDQFQLRFRAPAGTKFERPSSWRATSSTRSRDAAGPDNVEITLGYVGVQPLVVPDQHDLPLDRRVARRRAAGRAQAGGAAARSTTSRRSCGGASATRFPAAQFSFEPGDIVSRIMNFGAPTPVEVAVSGPDFAASRDVRGEGARASSRAIPALRDLQFGQALDYPAIQVDIDRAAGRAARRDRRSDRRARSPPRPRRAASSSPNYWADPRPASRSRCRSRCRSRG